MTAETRDRGGSSVSVTFFAGRGSGDKSDIFTLEKTEWLKRPDALFVLMSAAPTFVTSLPPLAKLTEKSVEELALCLTKSRVAWPSVKTFLLLKVADNYFFGDVFSCRGLKSEDLAATSTDECYSELMELKGEKNAPSTEGNSLDAPAKKQITKHELKLVRAGIKIIEDTGTPDPVALKPSCDLESLASYMRQMETIVNPETHFLFWRQCFASTKDAVFFKACAEANFCLVPVDVSEFPRFFEVFPRDRIVVVNNDWSDVRLLSSFSCPFSSCPQPFSLPQTPPCASVSSSSFASATAGKSGKQERRAVSKNYSEENMTVPFTLRINIH